MVFQQKFLGKAYFILKMTGPAMVRPAKFDFWKAPLDLFLTRSNFRGPYMINLTNHNVYCLILLPKLSASPSKGNF